MPEGMMPQDLARLGLERLAKARKERRAVPRGIAPALLAGWQEEMLLRQAGGGQISLELPEARKRWELLWQAFTGRW